MGRGWHSQVFSKVWLVFVTGQPWQVGVSLCQHVSPHCYDIVVGGVWSGAGRERGGRVNIPALLTAQSGPGSQVEKTDDSHISVFIYSDAEVVRTWGLASRLSCKCPVNTGREREDSVVTSPLAVLVMSTAASDFPTQMLIMKIVWPSSLIIQLKCYNRYSTLFYSTHNLSTIFLSLSSLYTNLIFWNNFFSIIKIATIVFVSKLLLTTVHMPGRSGETSLITR